MNQKVRFIHSADLHLGKTLYNIDQRYHDYFNAFEWLLNKAIKEKVDFILISGDFIDSERKINPSTLGNIISIIRDFHSKSQEELGRKIPILCILGNHETPFFSEHTWLKLLADLDLIIDLSGEYDNSSRRIRFKDYSPRENKGGKIQINNTVIYGMSYFGSSTPELYPIIHKEIEEEEDKFVILMMHFGIEGEDKRKKGYKMSKKLEKLHEKVDYLALGHFHKQYQKPEKDPWIYNPGSLEVNEITEISEDRGIFLVDVYREENNHYRAKPIICANGRLDEAGYIPNRKFLSFQINISESQSFEEAQVMILKKLRKLGVTERNDSPKPTTDLDVPILYLTLKGQINYSELEIDLSDLRNSIFETYEILGLKLNNQIFTLMGEGIQQDNDWKFDEIEKQAFLKTVEREEAFKPYKEEITHLILDQLKAKILKKADFDVVKKEFDNWFSINQGVLKEFMKIAKLARRPKKKKKIKRKKKKKKKKRPKKQSTIDESWSEEDFTKEFGKFKDILGDSDEDDEFDIDDIIDDGDSII
ncbi:MAG: metallophosphoesterase family protein [Promethearchaeia archaeon]